MALYHKRYLLLGVMVVLALLGTVRGQVVLAAGGEDFSGAQHFTGLSPAEAKELMAQNEELVVIDVRTLRERKEYALPGSIHREMRVVLREGLDIARDRPILLYCAVGGRSYGIGRVLAARGFETIYNLEGGIKAWQEHGYDVVRGEP